MKKWIFCPKCHKWFFIESYTVDRCPLCGRDIPKKIGGIV